MPSARTNPAPASTSPVAMPPDLLPRLDELLKAYWFAHEQGVSVSEFAIELDSLLAAGLTRTDIRILVRLGVLLHLRETDARSRAARRFVHDRSLSLSSRSAFVLTDETAAALRAARRRGNGSADRPRWDGRKRELRFRGQLVFRLVRPAPLLEKVLDAFQRCGWLPLITDPLHPTFSKASHRRLRGVTRRLNDAQRHHWLLRFGGDGSGERIRWEPREELIHKP
jgi:hypothetical protein